MASAEVASRIGAGNFVVHVVTNIFGSSNDAIKSPKLSCGADRCAERKKLSVLLEHPLCEWHERLKERVEILFCFWCWLLGHMWVSVVVVGRTCLARR
jgi:hypothetical protein